MTELLSHYGLLGLTIGLFTFLIIGLFHPIVVKCHYHFGVGCRWWFLVAGIIAGAASIAIENVMASSLLGVLSFTCLWTMREIVEQEERVERGWFPANPRRQKTAPEKTEK